jgi:enoyl-CoA hydratase
MDYQYLEIKKSGRIITVRLNRPESRNALCVDLMKELHDLALALRDDLAASVVVLTGGEKFFTAGVDLKDPKLTQIMQQPVSVRRRLFEMGPRMCAAWEDLPQVTIAAIEGFCLGGGVSLTASLDFRIMASDAVIRIPEIGLGMNYSWGTMARLYALVGPAWTRKWVLMAEAASGQEAAEAGFAQWTTDSGAALQKAFEIAEKIAAKPQAPVFMTKQAINAIGKMHQPPVHMDTDQFALSLLSEDFNEGIAAFFEKREPNFNKDLPEAEEV